MQDLGGYAPALVSAPGARLGISPILPNACAASVTGPPNPDGQCILGGRLFGPRCVAAPVFVRNNVPYSTGRIASTNYDFLEGVYSKTTQLNPDWGVYRPSVR